MINSLCPSYNSEEETSSLTALLLYFHAGIQVIGMLPNISLSSQSQTLLPEGTLNSLSLSQ